MSHVRESVGTSKQGSTKALAGSGISSMSLSLMAWKPRIDEPSNPKPSVNVSSSSSFNGIEKCCQVPGRSEKRTSELQSRPHLVCRLLLEKKKPRPPQRPRTFMNFAPADRTLLVYCR